MAIKRGLGKGLSTMIDTSKVIDESVVSELKIIDVEPNPDQPRKEFDEEKLEALSSSIKELGVILPIIVTKKNNRYQIIAGERRYRAAKSLGKETIPAIIKNFDDKIPLRGFLIGRFDAEI
jgi:ParB family chromosome partitioning protein